MNRNNWLVQPPTSWLLNHIVNHVFDNVNKSFEDLIDDVMYPDVNVLSNERHQSPI